jgi:hypothetical protein
MPGGLYLAFQKQSEKSHRGLQLALQAVERRLFSRSVYRLNPRSKRCSNLSSDNLCTRLDE